jgi:hypothetical protein
MAPGQHTEAARHQVHRAVAAVGGMASAGGSCLWHVVAWERALKEWALEQGWKGAGSARKPHPGS